MPYIQRPQKLRVANLLGQPAVGANAGVRRNSLRAKALRSNRRRKSEHEVWLSCGSQTTSICFDRRRWLKGGGQHPGQPNSLRELRSLTAALVGFWRLAVHSFSRQREKVRDEGAAFLLASGLHLGGVRRSLPQEWELKPPAIVSDICLPTKLSCSHPFCMRRGAQGVGWQLHRRVQLLRALTHRVCLNGAPRRAESYTVQHSTEHSQVALLNFA